MRKRMVTRTVTKTNVKVLCVDVDSQSTQVMEIELLTKKPNELKLRNLCRDKLETETLKVVHVVSADEVDVIYGMAEEDFVAHAEVLESRN